MKQRRHNWRKHISMGFDLMFDIDTCTQIITDTCARINRHHQSQHFHFWHVRLNADCSSFRPEQVPLTIFRITVTRADGMQPILYTWLNAIMHFLQFENEKRHAQRAPIGCVCNVNNNCVCNTYTEATKVTCVPRDLQLFVIRLDQ